MWVTRGLHARVERSLEPARTWISRLLGLVVLVVTSTVLTPIGIATAAVAPTGMAGTLQPAVDGDPDERAPLTREQVHSQTAAGERLEAQLTSSDQAVAAAQAKLATLAAQSSALMNQVVAAKAAEAAARASEAKELAALRSLMTQAMEARNDVTDLAYQAYVHGSGELSDVQAILEVATHGESGPSSVAVVDYLADARLAEGHRFESLAHAQRTIVSRVMVARRARETATKKAVEAQAKVAAAVTAQRTALTELQKLAAAKLSTGAAQAGWASAHFNSAALANLNSMPLCTGDTASYPNGLFPRSALCPIQGSQTDVMRPTAARALNALAIAYRADFGAELCVTDSYRSYQEQVDVKKRRGKWAATPGTSQHGLGLAVDLCGGIDSFGTAQHRWMKQHAPLFGFFHPDWAEPGGSLPEPWHWEYGG